MRPPRYARIDNYECPTTRWLLTGYLNRTWKVLGSFRGHQCRQLPEVCHQGPQAGQEEED